MVFCVLSALCSTSWSCEHRVNSANGLHLLRRISDIGTPIGFSSAWWFSWNMTCILVVHNGWIITIDNDWWWLMMVSAWWWRTEHDWTIFRYIGDHHPNWRTMTNSYFSKGWNYQPDQVDLGWVLKNPSIIQFLGIPGEAWRKLPSSQTRMAM